MIASARRPRYFIVARGHERAKDACGIISPEIKYRLRAIKRKSPGMFHKSSVLIRFYFIRQKITYRDENKIRILYLRER